MSDSLYSGRIGRLVFARNIAILVVAISLVVAVIRLLQNSDSDLARFALVILIIGSVYGGFVYSLSNVVRRLHDLDFSGWVALVFYLPPVGFILLIVLLVTPGSPSDNRFGSPSAG